MTTPLALLADIGGTNSRFALARDGQLDASTLWHTRNTDHAGFTEALAAYLSDKPAPALACIAAAGSVMRGRVALTNHPWTIDAAKLPFAKTHLLNDLQAMGYSLARFTAPEGARLVLNIGTGLNAAVLHRSGAHWHVPAAEHGFMRLPLLTAEENSILAACAAAHGAPVAEAVLSAASLPRLHHALTGESLSAAEISANWPAETLALYLKVLGCHLGDLALACLPHGGIWLAGSLGRAVFAQLTSPAFRHSFEDRGPYRALMQGFSFHCLEEDEAALHGAALYLSQGHAAPA